MISKCVICKGEFKTGDYLQAFLRNVGHPAGFWAASVFVDSGYQKRYFKNNDDIKRKHSACQNKKG